MKILKIFWKSLKEQVRDPVTLGLSLIIGHFFVLLYWLMIPSGSTTYGVLVQNLDLGPQGKEAITLLETLAYPSGDPLLDVISVSDQARAEDLLKDRDAEVLLIIPANFSEKLEAASRGKIQNPAEITLVGDLTNPYYAVGAVMAGSVLDEFVQVQTGDIRPVQFTEIALGASEGRSEFDLYIPGILIISVVMLVFIISMTITYEVEAGTLRRLQMTSMKASDLLIGISLPTVLLGVISLLLTIFVAILLGFSSQGSIWAALLIGGITAVAVVGVGLIVAAFSKSVSQAFIVANFPLIFFMFFSGAVYPIPRIILFQIAGFNISLYDLLPPTHAVMALNKILTLGADLADVLYEIISLLVLSLLYYLVGILIFQRRHLRLQ
ncbi:MAG: ABC transporter permease [Anaerolineales bacterium]|nr:ABC transporter permease [Anaerolineales bacterium]